MTHTIKKTVQTPKGKISYFIRDTFGMIMAFDSVHETSAYVEYDKTSIAHKDTTTYKIYNMKAV